MDIFMEQIVAKTPSGRDKLLKVLLIMSTVSLSIMFLFAAAMFPLLLIVVPGVIWVGSWLTKNVNVEYEYILTKSGSDSTTALDIDKIIGRNKRKRMVELDLRSAEEFGICNEKFSPVADVTVFAHDNSYTNMWYLKVKHGTHGKVLLLFNPNDEFAANLNKVLPVRIRNKKISELVEREKVAESVTAETEEKS